MLGTLAQAIFLLLLSASFIFLAYKVARRSDHKMEEGKPGSNFVQGSGVHNNESWETGIDDSTISDYNLGIPDMD